MNTIYDIILIDSFYECKNSEFQIGTLIINTMLSNEGITVKNININQLILLSEIDNDCIRNAEFDELANYILKYSPKIIGLSTMASSYHVSLLLSKFIKFKRPDIIVFFGGPHASLTYKDTLESFPWIDYICVGESEKYIVSFVKKILELEKPIELNGICFRNSQGDVVLNEMHEMIDLSEIPKLNYSNLASINTEEYFPLEAGRGCPFQCKYCSTKSFWHRKFRFRDLKSIIEEIVYLKRVYNIDRFSFIHDLFTSDKKNVIDFSRMILEYDIEWSCSSRIDTLDIETAKTMYSSGCRKIFIGIESGSDRIQKIINKNLDVNNLMAKIGIIKEIGFELTISFIIGFPEETIKDLEETLDMIKKLIKMGVKNIVVAKLSVLPGTEYYDEYIDSLIQVNHDSTSSMVEGTNTVKYNDLIINYKSLFTAFYKIPSLVNEKYIHLDKFIRFYISFISDHFPLVCNQVLFVEDKSILELYEILVSYIELDIPELVNFTNDNSRTDDTSTVLIKSIRTMVLLLEANYQMEGLLNLFNFELNISQFTPVSENTSSTMNFDYDVISMYIEHPSANKITKYNHSINFARLPDSTIEVTTINM